VPGLKLASLVAKAQISGRQPYVEEWEVPPFVDESTSRMVWKALDTSIRQFVLKKCELMTEIRYI
jgi:hypothetical protein